MLTGKTVLVSMGGGIGNAIFNLPLLAALKQQGAHVEALVGGDYPMAELWRRCIYLDRVLDEDHGGADHRIAGPWPAKQQRYPCRAYRWPKDYPLTYTRPEWDLILDGARALGWAGPPPDVRGWCGGLDRTPTWDVGIAPGGKPGPVWARKRYPAMAHVAQTLLDLGLTVATFGTKDDDALPGADLRDHGMLSSLPDLLARCRTFLGTDSGVTHLAASLGVPTTVLYTATSEVKGDPVRLSGKIALPLPCHPCQSSARWNACTDWICRAIPPARVVGVVLNWLGKGGVCYPSPS